MWCDVKRRHECATEYSWGLAVTPYLQMSGRLTDETIHQTEFLPHLIHSMYKESGKHSRASGYWIMHHSTFSFLQAILTRKQNFTQFFSIPLLMDFLASSSWHGSFWMSYLFNFELISFSLFVPSSILFKNARIIRCHASHGPTATVSHMPFLFAIWNQHSSMDTVNVIRSGQNAIVLVRIIDGNYF